MSKWTSVDVICPFYHSEDTSKIRCEGVSSNTSIHLCFGDPKEKKDYQRQFCDSRYMSCRIAQMLNKKWEDGKGSI